MSLATIALFQLGILTGPHLHNPRDGGVTVNWETSLSTNGEVWTLNPITRAFLRFPATPGRYHRAELDGLPSDTIHFYAVRSDDGYSSVWSPLLMFRTLPRAGGSFRIGVWGDNQVGSSTFHTMVERFIGESCTVYLGLGDYIQNEGLNGEWHSLFFDHMGPVLGYLPVAGPRGNHDGEDSCAKGLWPLPNNNDWGALTWGNARVVLLNSNEHYPMRYTLQRGGEQRLWLEQEMQGNEWRSAAFRIVAFHHPHATEQWDGGCYYGVSGRDQLLSDLVDNTLVPGGVNLILNGHAHSYQRGQLGPNQFHVISGGGGGWLDNPQCFDQAYITVNPGTSQFYHFLTMDVTATDLTVRCIKLGNRTVFDQFTIQAQPLR